MPKPYIASASRPTRTEPVRSGAIGARLAVGSTILVWIAITASLNSLIGDLLLAAILSTVLTVGFVGVGAGIMEIDGEH